MNMDKITANEVVEWAKKFLVLSDKELTSEEVKEQKKYATLIQNPNNKTLLSKMLDESSQIRDSKILSRRLKYLIDKYGIPTFFTPWERFQLSLFTGFGYLFDPIAIPIFKNKLQADTHKIIIPEERPALTEHLSKRWKQQIGQNVNLLGEVVLGDEEANNRFHQYMEALKEPDINYISVKLSGIYAQIRPLSYKESKEKLCELVASIFRQAMKYPYKDHSGKERSKFVNLDMEEYKDAELTYDVFKTVLAQEEFLPYRAGIVIQAYLPDALFFYRDLLAFAKERCARGGVPIKFRLVKGANLQMETIVSSLKGWKNPILPTKVAVDTNHLHLLDEALQPENVECLNIGVATHNFFSIGYAYLLSERNQVTDHVTFEMLEGMANHLPRVMRALNKQIILYTPVVRKEYFLNAVSYLVRRLDENTGPDNFLSYSFELEVNSQAWDFLENQFRTAFANKDSVKPDIFRKQNRMEPAKPVDEKVFANEPDTELDLPQNRKWALGILEKWKDVRADQFKVPMQIGAQFMESDSKRQYLDKSRNDSVSMCEASLSSLDHIKQIINIAEKDEVQWSNTSLQERKKILYQVADNLANQRGELIGCIAAITGKAFMEGDVEVSEAIDFCRFYPTSLQEYEKLEHISMTPKGVVLVISPWNFPLAIPVGGVSSALAAGNRVILKPATSALPVAWKFAECFWEAGVPKEALQIVCPAEYSTLDYLTAHPSIKHITLTGGTDTAFKILEKAPKTPLSAETGGKNCIIVTARGDQDHAIQSIVASAFGNAGQKCSACSLLLLDKGAFKDPLFKQKLTDAVTSIPVGSVWDSETVVGPMITNKNDKLLKAIDKLESGESWLVKPEFIDEKKYMLKPCVKWNVKPDSYTFKTELFAPLLSVVCIDSLEEAITIANSSEYGLTSGLQSLDEHEVEYWMARIEAGNLYINRGITGAIVNRQPFGGMKRSAFGGGIKAGGPNYAATFTNIAEKGSIPATKWLSPFDAYLQEGVDKTKINFAYQSYSDSWKEIFTQAVDVNKLEGEQNLFRYLPLKNMGVRVQVEDSLLEILLILQALQVSGVKAVLSIDKDDKKLSLLDEILKKENLNISLVIESENEFINRLDQFERIRMSTAQYSDALYHAVAKRGLYIAHHKPLVEGRVELLNYVKEQSVSYEYHRYGSVLDERFK